MTGPQTPSRSSERSAAVGGDAGVVVTGDGNRVEQRTVLVLPGALRAAVAEKDVVRLHNLPTLDSRLFQGRQDTLMRLAQLPADGTGAYSTRACGTWAGSARAPSPCTTPTGSTTATAARCGGSTPTGRNRTPSAWRSWSQGRRPGMSVPRYPPSSPHPEGRTGPGTDREREPGLRWGLPLARRPATRTSPCAAAVQQPVPCATFRVLRGAQPDRGRVAAVDARSATPRGP